MAFLMIKMKSLLWDFEALQDLLLPALGLIPTGVVTLAPVTLPFPGPLQVQLPLRGALSPHQTTQLT